MAQLTRCPVDGCSSTIRNAPLCAPHWKLVPEDLKERYRYAKRADEDDIPFAIRACAEAVE